MIASRLRHVSQQLEIHGDVANNTGGDFRSAHRKLWLGLMDLPFGACTASHVEFLPWLNIDAPFE